MSKRSPRARRSRRPRNGHLAWLRRRHLALHLALREAKRRFGKFEGVLGFGIGKKLKGRRARVVRVPGAPGGLCVHVFVAEKRALRSLKNHPELIPQRLPVRIPGKRRAVMVPLDVITFGPSNLGNTEAFQQSGQQRRELTSVNHIAVGRLFGVSPRPGGRDGLETGTLGAYIWDRDEGHYGVTAGHVFVDTSLRPWRVRTSDRRIYVKNSAGPSIRSTQLFPKNLDSDENDPGRLHDCVLFRVPPELRPAPADCSWPKDFDGNLAAESDEEQVLAANPDRSFLWVQRESSLNMSGSPSQETWALEVEVVSLRKGDERLSIAAAGTGLMIGYPDVWCYKFPSLSGLTGEPSDPWRVSLGGDSGAGLYVWSAADPSKARLLGFHFYLWRDPKNMQWYGLAMPAEENLRILLKNGVHGKDWWFYGKK